MQRVTFPKWTNTIRPVATAVLLGGPVYVFGLLYYGFWPTTLAVGYEPAQPVPYSHKVHAGDLGIDCRYCHTTVEESAHASVPPTETCMNCHQAIWPESENLVEVFDSYATGLPVEWVRVHDLPDFAYFNHSRHVNSGIGCVTCHGRVDKMEIVSQDQPLHMGWCLECHRNPEKYLRPKEFVTVMDWVPTEDQLTLGRRLREEYDVNPSTDCSTCHR
jgi:hypothetical protein